MFKPKQYHRLLTLILIAALTGCGASTPNTSTNSATSAAIPAVVNGRGIWFWESAAQQAIVLTPSLQPAVIANFKKWGVTSVYGSYTSQIASAPAAVRSWNTLLAANGIASYTLVSSGDFFLPEQWPTTQTWLQTNFLAFNAASTPAQSFVGVAFDVEPASFTGNGTRASWNAATPAVRRTYLTYFTDMFTSTRAFLAANGAPSALIQTYIVTWWSTLNGSILWASATDQSQWYAQLAALCDRITVEQYETANTSTILSGFQASDTLLLGKSRVALNSADTVWSPTSLFWQTIPIVESQTTRFIDIEDYDTTTGP